MKKHDFLDIRELMDEIFGAAEEFKNAFANEFQDFGKHHPFGMNEYRDFYPGYSYPPVNVYLQEDKTMVLQFALAGFSEGDIHLEFKGDYLVFSAEAPTDFEPGETVRYFKRRLKLKSVKGQKYFVPVDKYDQEHVDAVLRNSILTVTIPPREEVQEPDGVRVNIKAEKASKPQRTSSKSDSEQEAKQ